MNKNLETFAITAMGRSGTRFLSRNMNLSKKWTINHEPGSRWQDLKNPAHIIQARFNQPFYGEVNSYLRYIIDSLEVGKRGVILRSPIDIWFSITARHNLEYKKGTRLREHDFGEVIQAIPHLLTLAESGKYLVIDFERMISNVDYLIGMFNYFGIDDVEITQQILDAKINASSKHQKTNWEDFSCEIRNAIHKLNDEYLQRTEKLFQRGKL